MKRLASPQTERLKHFVKSFLAQSVKNNERSKQTSEAGTSQVYKPKYKSFLQLHPLQEEHFSDVLLLDLLWFKGIFVAAVQR